MLTRLFGPFVSARIARLLLVLAALLGGWQAEAASITVAGHLPRNLTNGNFQITVTIAGISALEYTAGLGDTAVDPLKFQHRLQIFFVGNGYSSSMALPYKAADIAAPTLFYVTQNSFNQSQAQDGTWTFTYVVDVNAAASNALSLATNNGNSLVVGANFYLNATGALTQTTASTTATGVTIYQTTGIAKDAPVFAPSAPIIGSMNSLSINWVAPANNQIATIGANSVIGSADAGSVVAYAFDETAGITQLPTLTYVPSAPTTTPDVAGNHCTYTPPAANQVNSQCITCDDTTSLFYLDVSKMGALPGIHTVSGAAKGGAATLSGLINDKPYVVFLQYDYPSLVPSGGQQCLLGKPSPNYTMTEINGESVGKIVDFRCFIATAAYGSPLHRDLRLFRKFRDRVLLTNPVGRRFVHYYYKFSPPLADFIAAHATLRQIVRSMLALPAAVLRQADSYY